MPALLDLGEQLNISNVHECHLAWREIVDANDEVVADVSRLTNVDTAGLQLLLVLKQRLAKASLGIEWHEPNDEFIAVARLVGLESALELGND